MGTGPITRTRTGDQAGVVVLIHPTQMRPLTRALMTTPMHPVMLMATSRRLLSQSPPIHMLTNQLMSGVMLTKLLCARLATVEHICVATPQRGATGAAMLTPHLIELGMSIRRATGPAYNRPM